MSKNVGVIICAAGVSSRFGGKKKKPFVDVAGRAAFLRSVELFSDRKDVKQVLVGISEDDKEMFEIKWGANLQFYGVKTYFGGEERFETVEKGLDLINEEIDLVAVHDAARCCLTDDLIGACIEEAAKSKAAILASPVVATIKKVKNGVIEETVDRSDLYEAQTPQIFEKELLKRAYANLKNLDRSSISDDAQLVEALGETVSIVETDSSNMKITTQSDVAIAEAILKTRAKQQPKGYVGPYNDANW